MKSHNSFTGTVLLFGTLLLASDQLYRLYKFQDKTFYAGSKSNYLLYDGFFFSIYYAFGTALYFTLGGLLLLSPSPKSAFWRFLSTILHFTFFGECEALLEFIVHFEEISKHIAMTSWNWNMFRAFFVLGLVRWRVALLMMKQMFTLEQDIVRDVLGFTKKRSKCCCCFCDYDHHHF